MKKNVSIGLIFLSSLIACKKENNNSTTDSKIYFIGFTKTDEMGNLMSKPDTTDWRFDDIWSTKEENLFSIKYNNSNKKCATSINLLPNPFRYIFNISLINKPNSSRLAVRLVNKDFKVLFQSDSINNLITAIEPTNISSYDTLRLYYKLIDSLNYEYKGHGDILILK